MLGLNYRFLRKAAKLINTTEVCVNLLKNLIDMLMKHLHLHHATKCGAFTIEMYGFLYHSYSEIQHTTFYGHLWVNTT